jgi:circadian clock protein KaiC
VLPISSLGLDYPAGQERVSTGIPRLDSMLGGQGYYRGSSVLVSGSAGIGKTSIAAAFANSVCGQGERCLFVGFEEAPAQIVRNMASIGYDLGQWVDRGRLRFHTVRSTVYGLEQHLVRLHRLVQEFQPSAVILDPVTNLDAVGSADQITAMLARVIDFLKNQGVTALFTSLIEGGSALERSEVNISSLMDTWLLLRSVETAGERNRLLFILKSRGMAHSNQVREFLLTDQGIQLRDVYVGPGAVLTGSARLMQEFQDTAQAIAQMQANAWRRRELEQERMALRAQIEALQLKNEALADELHTLEADESAHLETVEQERVDMAAARSAD